MDFKGGEGKVLPKRWNEDSFTGELFCSQTGLVKHHGLQLIPYDYVGPEQMLGVLNTCGKDLLLEYHYRLFKCFESSQRTTDAKLSVLLSKR